MEGNELLKVLLSLYRLNCSSAAVCSRLRQAEVRYVFLQNLKLAICEGFEVRGFYEMIKNHCDK
jgi:hypothetical protein